MKNQETTLNNAGRSDDAFLLDDAVEHFFTPLLSPCYGRNDEDSNADDRKSAQWLASWLSTSRSSPYAFSASVTVVPPDAFSALFDSGCASTATDFVAGDRCQRFVAIAEESVDPPEQQKHTRLNCLVDSAALRRALKLVTQQHRHVVPTPPSDGTDGNQPPASQYNPPTITYNTAPHVRTSQEERGAAWPACDLLHFALPKNYDVWNARRRRVIAEFAACASHVTRRELMFSGAVLALHPKVAEIWEYRKWVVDSMVLGPSWDSNSSPPLVDLLLRGEWRLIVRTAVEKHPRNYLAWAYMQWLLSRLSVTPRCCAATQWRLTTVLRGCYLDFLATSGCCHDASCISNINALLDEAVRACATSCDRCLGETRDAIRACLCASQRYLRLVLAGCCRNEHTSSSSPTATNAPGGNFGLVLSGPIDQAQDKVDSASRATCLWLLRRGVVHCSVLLRSVSQSVKTGPHLQTPIAGAWTLADELEYVDACLDMINEQQLQWTGMGGTQEAMTGTEHDSTLTATYRYFVWLAALVK